MSKWDRLAIDEGEHGHHVIIATLDPVEAENIAYALGLHDTGARDLLEAADERDRIKAELGDPSRHYIMDGCLVIDTGRHTCGTGPGGHYGAHEPGCGLEQALQLDNLQGWPGDERDRLRAAVRQIADACHWSHDPSGDPEALVAHIGQLRQIAEDASDERDRLAGVLAATPVTRSAAAYGWDRAIASLRYEDGTSVEIVTQSNPFALRPTDAARQLRERLGALDGADEQHEGWGR